MPAPTDQPYDVFISYADGDRAWVEGYLLDALNQAGVRCQTETSFSLGVPRLEEFERAIRQSRRTLLVLSAASAADGFTRFTDLLAQSYGAAEAAWPVIPVMRADVELPRRLAMLEKVDAGDPSRWPEVIKRICDELLCPVPGPASRPTCPYPGMIPFRARDARFFYGREVEIEKMVQHLRHQRFLCVIGPSGSGKSSLIHAGLLPCLPQSSYFPPGHWLVRAMRPGNKPLHTLTELLGAAPTAPLPAQRVLLVVDQFEELFAQNDPAEQSRFIGALKALRSEEHVAILLVMRADFYQDLMTSALWPVDPGQRLEVGPLRGEAMRRAIRQPATEVGVHLEAGLLERLLADADEEPGVLPLVQETMVLLWDKMQRRLLPYSEYEKLGQGGPNGLTVAMARKAEATLADLAETRQKIARRIFLRLVQFGEGRADTRRQQSVEDLRSTKDDRAEFDQTLEHLARHRLLTRGGEADARGPVVDIAHEMLIIGWPRSQEWVQSRREAELVRRRLEAKAKEWAERVRRGQAGGLLDEAELPEAERWLRSPDAEDLGYDDALTALVQTSRSASDEAERQREAARQRELQQAQALAAEQRRRAKTLSRSLIVLGALLAVAVGTALYAWSLYGSLRAEEARRRQEYALSNAKLAKEAIRRGDWNVALEASEEALKVGSEELDEIALGLARVRALVALNKLADAKQELEALGQRTDLGSHEGATLLWQADLLLEQDMRNPKALGLVRQALEKGVSGADEAYAKALVAQSVVEAIHHLEEARGADPMSHRAYTMLAQLQFWSSQDRECHECLLFAEKAFSEDPTFKILHALLSARRGNKEDAANWLAKAKHQLSRPQQDTARKTVEGMMLIHQRDLDQSTLAGRDPGVVELFAKMGGPSLLILGKSAELDQRLDSEKNTARSLLLGVPPPVVLKGYERVKNLVFRSTGPSLFRGNADRFLEEISAAIREYPDGMLYLIRGNLLVEKNRRSEAEKSFRLAADTPSLFGRYARLQSLWFMLFVRTDLAQANPQQLELKRKAVLTLKELFREYMSDGSIHPEVAANLATLSLALGESDLARAIIREGERKDPDNVELLRKRLLADKVSGNHLGMIETATRLLDLKLTEKERQTILDLHDFAVDQVRAKMKTARPLKKGSP